MPNSGTRVNLEVDFFGGEPLMNWQVVKDLVAYARTQEPIYHKNFRFTLTTNGVLLDDEVIGVLPTGRCSNVVLSLDGRKEVHDRLRKDYRRGRAAMTSLSPNSRSFVEARGDKSYYMRGTFTHDNVDFTNDIFHMADLGFTELSMEPVVSRSRRALGLDGRGPAQARLSSMRCWPRRCSSGRRRGGPSPSTTTCWI